ncbi:MAG: TolC family protein [Muribaculaceae bacterium]|nr:TolC family protein [Muribaculaceae bacterium]
MTNKILIMPLLAVSAVIPAGAVGKQAPDSVYSMEQCVEMAVANNAAVKMADNDMAAAVQTRKEAFSKYFPTVQAGATAFKTNHDAIQYNVLDLFTLGIINKGKSAGIWAVQPVFAGGQIVNGNKLARVGEEVASIRREQQTDDVILETRRLYWQLASLKATRRTLESAITMLDTLGANVKTAVDAGIVIANDYLKVELQRNKYRSTLVDVDNGISLMRMLLAQQMGLGMDSTAVDIDARIPLELPTFPDDVYVESSEALPLTADHKLLVKNVEARELEKKMEVGRNLPTVGVGAGWFYHDVFNQNHNFAGVMVTVSVPLSGWWGGSHAIKRRNLEVTNARLELENLSQKLQIEMTDKWDNLAGAYRKMEIAVEAMDQSAENLRITRAYYDAGMNTIADLLDAQTLYVKAQDEYIASVGTFMITGGEYLNATGQLRK